YATPITPDVDTVTVHATDGIDDEIETVAVTIDPAEAAVTDTVTVGDAPSGVAVHGDRAYVTNSNGTVSVIDTTTNTVVASIPVGAQSRVGVAVSADGTRAYVTTNSNGLVSVIDTATNTVIDTIAVGAAPSDVAIRGDRVYVTNISGGT